MSNVKNVSTRSCFGLAPLSSQIDSVAKKLLGKRGFANADLLLHWSDIIGEELSQVVKPEKITHTKESVHGAILHVRVASGAFAVVVEHQKRILLDKINTFLGYNAVSDIKIRQDFIELKPAQNSDKMPELTSEQKQFLSQKLQNIEDEELKKKLYNIGMLIFFK